MASEVICIETQGERNDCTCITHIVIKNQQRYSVDGILYWLKKGYEFYVINPDNQSKVFVQAAEKNGKKYIRTKDKDSSDDLLLILPQCE